MGTLKAFKYRLYPTKEQQRLLDRQLEECRWLWNTLLAERKSAWEERQESVDYYAQKAELPDLKATDHPALREVHSQVLQDVVLRLKKAFDAFSRRMTAGEEPGYPRFRGLHAGCGGQAGGGLQDRAHQGAPASPAGGQAQDGHYPADGHWQMVRLDRLRMGANAPAPRRARGGH